jgi:hypothetical protein
MRVSKVYGNVYSLKCLHTIKIVDTYDSDIAPLSLWDEDRRRC